MPQTHPPNGSDLPVSSMAIKLLQSIVVENGQKRQIRIGRPTHVACRNLSGGLLDGLVFDVSNNGLSLFVDRDFLFSERVVCGEFAFKSLHYFQQGRLEKRTHGSFLVGDRIRLTGWSIDLLSVWKQ